MKLCVSLAFMECFDDNSPDMIESLDLMRMFVGESAQQMTTTGFDYR